MIVQLDALCFANQQGVAARFCLKGKLVVKKIVVVGGGHAAAQFCASINEAGQDVQVVLVTAEGYLPYQRPPLSKTWLKDEDPQPAWLRPASFYADNTIDVHVNTRVSAIDPAAQSVTLYSGDTLSYDALVLATGARARTLPLFGGNFSNVTAVRTIADARCLREQVAAASRVVVVGGGFIGLEVAATAAGLGKHVTVLEASDRLLGRSVSPEVSDWLLQAHQANGVTIELNARADRLDVVDEKVTGIWVGDKQFAADVVVLAVGSEPNVDLAQAAGLACDNGVVVNEFMQTSQPDIYAIGDCTAFPSATLGRRVRLESVQNANDQARCAARSILGDPVPYTAMPWFWSDQGAIRIQIAGVPDTHHERALRGDPASGKFSVLYFDGDRLTCAESVNLPVDHMAARRLIAEQVVVDRAKALDPTVALKTLGQA